jgi:hypothetical protein
MTSPWENYGLPPSPPVNALRDDYHKKIDIFIQKVTTELPNGERAQVYTHSNMLQLSKIYEIIKESSALYELEIRIKHILKEHKEISDVIGKTYGIGFLKK